MREIDRTGGQSEMFHPPPPGFPQKVPRSTRFQRFIFKPWTPATEKDKTIEISRRPHAKIVLCKNVAKLEGLTSGRETPLVTSQRVVLISFSPRESLL